MNLDDRIRQSLHAAADPPAPLHDPDALVRELATRTPARVVAARTWAAWFAGGAAVVAVTAGVLGALGVFGRPAPETATPVSARVVAVNALDCPGGGAVRSFRRDDRVLVVARSADGWLGVRDPADLGRVVWVPAATLRSDDGQAEVASLPVRTCDAATAADAADPVAAGADPVPVPATPAEPAPPTTAVDPLAGPPTAGAAPVAGTPGGGPAPGPGPAPVPVPVPGGNPTPGPTTTTAAPPAADTQRPAFGNASAAPTQLCDVVQQGWSTTSNLTAFVTDNVGVTSVTATWSGLPGSGVQLTKASATTWTATIGPFNGAVPSNQSVNLTITLTARDAAGNTATTTTGPVRVFDAGLCLF